MKQWIITLTSAEPLARPEHRAAAQNCSTVRQGTDGMRSSLGLRKVKRHNSSYYVVWLILFYLEARASPQHPAVHKERGTRYCL